MTKYEECPYCNCEVTGVNYHEAGGGSADCLAALKKKCNELHKELEKLQPCVIKQQVSNITLDEALNLPSSPELDVLVAQCVTLKYTVGTSSHKGKVIIWPNPNGSGVEFSPSTDIAIAMWLVDVLVDSGFSFGAFTNHGSGAYCVRLLEEKKLHLGYGSTFTLAICRAILRTKWDSRVSKES